MSIRATSQFSIVDLQDITIGATLPTTGVLNEIFLLTSKTPNELHRWDGIKWVFAGTDLSTLVDDLTNVTDRVVAVEDDLDVVEDAVSGYGLSVEVLNALISSNDIRKQPHPPTVEPPEANYEFLWLKDDESTPLLLRWNGVSWVPSLPSDLSELDAVAKELLESAANSEDVRELQGTVGDLASSVNEKANNSEFKALQASYDQVTTDLISSRDSAVDRMDAIDVAQTSIFTKLGQNKQVLDFINSTIEFTAQGLIIKNKNNTMSLLLDDTSIKFMDGTSVVAEITNQYMRINHGIFVKSIEVGNHMIQSLPGSEITQITYTGGRPNG
jgi:hypothetical protein